MGIKNILFHDAAIEFLEERYRAVHQETCPEEFRKNNADFFLWTELKEMRMDRIQIQLEGARFRKTLIRIALILSFVSTFSSLAPSMVDIVLAMIMGGV